MLGNRKVLLDCNLTHGSRLRARRDGSIVNTAPLDVERRFLCGAGMMVTTRALDLAWDSIGDVNVVAPRAACCLCPCSGRS